MIAYSGNSLKSGIKILIKKQPYEVYSSEFIKPGKGQAFVRIKLKQLLTGKLFFKTVKATDIFYSADVVDIETSYLYNNGSIWFFMHKKTFEHISVLKKFLFGCEKWLTNLASSVITLWHDSPILVRIDNFVQLKVYDVDSVILGDTINADTKSVTLETGTIIRAPLFIKKGDILKIDTRSGKYISRVAK